MLSITTMGQLLFTIPFTIIALHSIKEYLKDRENSRKKHLCYAFSFWSIGFIQLLIGGLIFPCESEGIILTKLFDVFNIIGLFWFFVFLTDFMENMKKYIPFVFIHMAITIAIILSTKAGRIAVGSELMVGRGEIRSLAILFFWFLYWSIIAYQFWKYSKLMTNKVAIRRCQMMSAGAVLAISAYVATTIAAVYQNLAPHFAGIIFAAAAGVVFYIGFIVPEWLRIRWEKHRDLDYIEI